MLWSSSLFTLRNPSRRSELTASDVTLSSSLSCQESITSQYLRQCEPEISVYMLVGVLCRDLGAADQTRGFAPLGLRGLGSAMGLGTYRENGLSAWSIAATGRRLVEGAVVGPCIRGAGSRGPGWGDGTVGGWVLCSTVLRRSWTCSPSSVVAEALSSSVSDAVSSAEDTSNW